MITMIGNACLPMDLVAQKIKIKPMYRSKLAGCVLVAVLLPDAHLPAYIISSYNSTVCREMATPCLIRWRTRAATTLIKCNSNMVDDRQIIPSLKLSNIRDVFIIHP